MANNVVLASDLALLKADSVLRFNGTSEYAIDIPFDDAVTWGYEVHMCFANSSLSGLHVFCGAQNGTGAAPRAYLSISDGFLSYGIGDSPAGSNVTTFQPTIGTYYEIEAVYDGSIFTLTVDSVIVSQKTTPVDTLRSPIGLAAYGVGGTPNSFFTECQVCFFSYTENGTRYNYTTKDQFGNTFLIEDGQSGNDGEIEATWWKKDVGEFYTDWTTYWSTLPVTPVEFQNVTVVDVEVPPLPWGNYDENWVNLVFQDSGLGELRFGMSSFPCIGINFKIRNRRGL